MAELEVEFEETSHSYTLDGVRVPSCTQVLSGVGATPGFSWMSLEQLQFYRDRGHSVHSCVEYSIKGSLDKRSAGYRDVKGYVIGWERAVNDLGIEVLKLDGEPFVEKPLIHPAYRYGVKPDVIAYVRAYKDSGPVEIKATSAHSPATGLQLGSQLIAVRHVMPDIGRLRVGLRLLPNEPYYDAKMYTERSDEAVWLSMLNTYNWLQTHKLLKENR